MTICDGCKQDKHTQTREYCSACLSEVEEIQEIVEVIDQVVKEDE